MWLVVCAGTRPPPGQFANATERKQAATKQGAARGLHPPQQETEVGEGEEGKEGRVHVQLATSDHTSADNDTSTESDLANDAPWS